MLTIDEQNALQDDSDNQKRIKARVIAQELFGHPDLYEALADYIAGHTGELDGLILEIKERNYDDQ
jgi:hypothetical protein